MNYVPGTASLIDDIDSKSRSRFRSLLHRGGFGGKIASRCGIVSDTSWITCDRLTLQLNLLVLVVSCREAPGAAPRWQNTDRLPQKH